MSRSWKSVIIADEHTNHAILGLCGPFSSNQEFSSKIWFHQLWVLMAPQLHGWSLSYGPSTYKNNKWANPEKNAVIKNWQTDRPKFMKPSQSMVPIILATSKHLIKELQSLKNLEISVLSIFNVYVIMLCIYVNSSFYDCFMKIHHFITYVCMYVCTGFELSLCTSQIAK